jgi:predicted MPP superfamily phosphohydrolase
MPVEDMAVILAPRAPPAQQIPRVTGWEHVPVHLQPLARGLGAVGVAAVAGIGYATLEAQAFTLRRFTLPVLPAGAPSLRVLHVSDLHLVPRQRRKAAWLRSLARLEPDLVVSTGDNLAAKDAVPAVLDAYGELLRRPGVFVLGSNDYWGPRPKNPARYLLPQGGGRPIVGVPLPTGELVAGFREAGWLDLSNRRGTLDVAGVRLAFVGVDDPHMRWDRYPPAEERASDQSAASETPALTVGVLHAPYRRVLDAMAADGAKLLLAGHTHGGQLCLPGLGALVTNSDPPARQARGVSAWPAVHASKNGGGHVLEADRGENRGGSILHVSAGLGTSPYTPVRFACRPEASLLTLTSA